LNEIKRLVPFLLEHKRIDDEIVILYDEKNGNPQILDFLLPYNIKPNIQTWVGFEFQNNFAEWKNKLNSLCIGDYIFQLDADEMISEYLIKNLHNIIENNKNVNLIRVPRINIVEGITQEYINMWGWKIDDNDYINFPDIQPRIYKKNMHWHGKIHERIATGVLGGSSITLPTTNEYCIYHHKTIERQKKQMDFYTKIEYN
jgi:hypothetical protein